MKTIIFKGEEYLFGRDSLDEDGFITKREDYQNGICSYAHYYHEQGVVIRFGEQIGMREDIGDDDDPEVNFATALENLLTPGRGGWLFAIERKG